MQKYCKYITKENWVRDRFNVEAEPHALNAMHTNSSLQGAFSAAGKVDIGKLRGNLGTEEELSPLHCACVFLLK